MPGRPLAIASAAKGSKSGAISFDVLDNEDTDAAASQ